MATKKKNPQFMTPKGTLRFPALTKPDYGTKEHPKEFGQWKADLILNAEDAQELIAKLQPLYDQAIADGKEAFKGLKVEARKKLKDITEQPFYEEEYDRETEEPTGRIIFKFRSVYSGVKDGKKWTRKIALFDAKGKPLLKVPEIWGGSVAKVSFGVAPYFIAGTALTGIKYYLEAVQIIDLRNGAQKDASAYGFGEEDGYDGSNEEGSDEDEASPFDNEEGADADESPDF